MNYLLTFTAAASIAVFVGFIVRACFAAIRTRRARPWSSSKPSRISPAMEAIVPIVALGTFVLSVVARDTDSVGVALAVAAVVMTIVGIVYVAASRSKQSVTESWGGKFRPGNRPVDRGESFQSVDDVALDDYTEDPYRLTRQGREILTTLVPLIRERSVIDGVEPDDRNDQAKKFLDDLACALNEIANDGGPVQRRRIWFHRDRGQVSRAVAVQRERIDRRWLLDLTATYLAQPWMRHPEIDWILLDALIYAELSAYRDAILSGTVAGRMHWSYILAKDHPLRMMILASLGPILRYVLPAMLIAALAANDYAGIALTLGFFFALYALNRFFGWWRLRRAATLLEKMLAAYVYCEPPIVNPSVLRERLSAAASAGAVFDAAVFSMLSRIESENQAAFLPLKLR